MTVACAPSAPASYTATVDRPVAEVRTALAELSEDGLSSASWLPPVTAGISPDGRIVWNLYVGDNMAGQLQIALSDQGPGKTAVSATYAPASLRAADMVVPALRNPKTLADLMFKALEARVTALDPQSPPHVVKRNISLSDDHLKTARIAVNPNAIPDNVEEAFQETAKALEESSESISLPPPVESPPPPSDQDTGRPPPKFGEPTLDPNPDRKAE